MTTKRDPTFKLYPFKREGLTAILLRQIQVRDDIAVNQQVDKQMRKHPEMDGGNLSMAAYLALQKREAVRHSIFAVIREGSDQLEQVGDTEPFAELDDWLDTSFGLLSQMHRDINEVTEEEDFRKGAEILSPAEVAARIIRAPAGTTAQAARGSAAPAGG